MEAFEEYEKMTGALALADMVRLHLARMLAYSTAFSSSSS